ncbi:hypothetical protein BC831DRAFT_444239 [Entophlyctis helioformis]|nr:hypothetical protein BC831DRAFT_444239 [Entophlyctis helioformis]
MSTHNLFLLRHVMTGKVLVSPRLRLDSVLLNQIGEHRPQNKVRPDHWVPFLAVTGFKRPETVASLQAAIAPPHKFFGPKTRWPLPEANRNDGWKIPDMVKERTIALCRALETSDAVRADVHGSSASQQAQDGLAAAATADTNAAAADAAALDAPTALTMWWERDEFRYLVDEADIFWPEFVAHEKMTLARGRYPVWPEGSGVNEVVYDPAAARVHKSKQHA